MLVIDQAMLARALCTFVVPPISRMMNEIVGGGGEKGGTGTGQVGMLSTRTLSSLPKVLQTRSGQGDAGMMLQGAR